MNIIDIYKKALRTIFVNPNIVMFFVLYMIASSILAGCTIGAKPPFGIILVLCFFVFALSFVSGWLEMIKASTRTQEEKKYWEIFLEGIGKNIVSLGFGFLIYLVIFVGVIMLSAKISQNVFGGLDFISRDALASIQNNQDFMKYFESLTDEQRNILSAWQIVYIFSSLIYSFLMLFYYPSIVFDEKTNVFLKPLFALKNSFCFLFKNFFGALLIHITIFTTYILLSYIKMRFGVNIFISIMLVFCYIYFISGAIMLIFSYYEQRNNCVDGCNCIRENKDIN